MNGRILIIGLALAISADAGPYSFRSVEICASSESEAVFGINNSGAVAGLVFDATGPRAFFGNPGAFNLLNIPGAAFTEAVDITESGVVSGDYLDASGTLRVFVRDTDGTLTTLPMIPGAGAMSGGKMNTTGTLIGNYAADPMASTGANAFVVTGLALDFTFSAPGGVHFASKVPSDAVPISGDPQYVRRLFFILIDNAVKYTPPGGRVAVELRTDGHFAIGVIRDTGIGIGERDLPRIFDRFWRADKVRSRESGGAGLGLSIAQWIAKRYGGEIRVDSKLGEGSTFTVLLPLG